MDKCELFRRRSNSPLDAAEYEDDVDHRTTDKVYADAGVSPLDVFKLRPSWWPKNGGGGDMYLYGVALVRRAARFLVTPVVDWAVASDNPDVKNRIKKQDLAECQSKAE